MQLNMFNPIEAIYSNAFSLGQVIELQIMTALVRLLMYLLFVINLPPFKLFNIEGTVFHQTYRFEIARQRNIFFFKKKEKRKKNDFSFT